MRCAVDYWARSGLCLEIILSRKVIIARFNQRGGQAKVVPRARLELKGVAQYRALEPLRIDHAALAPSTVALVGGGVRHCSNPEVGKAP